jgi:hypothetical protein
MGVARYRSEDHVEEEERRQEHNQLGGGLVGDVAYHRRDEDGDEKGNDEQRIEDVLLLAEGLEVLRRYDPGLGEPHGSLTSPFPHKLEVDVL